MPEVRIVQLLCPQRHCIIGAAYEVGNDTFENIRTVLDHIVRTRAVNPWCGICGSEELTYEDAKTLFHSLTEAMPALQKTQADNLSTRAPLDRLGQSRDEQKKN